MVNTVNPFHIPPALLARDAGPIRKKFRERIDSGPVLLLPGVTDAITAVVAAETGFEACYVTGAGFANAQFGLADVGLVSQAELVEQARRICAAVDIPVVVDADTGYGGPLNVMRTTAELERAGVAAIQIEDQVMPKRCGHFADKEVIPANEMAAKIRAACDARSDSNLVLIARTDAAQRLGLEEALSRGRMYRDAGADVVFVEAPRTVDELYRIPREIPGVPHLANVVEGGLSPVLTRSQYEEMGYGIVLYANLALRSALFAVRHALGHLHEVGDSQALGDRMLEWSVRQDLVGLDGLLALEKKYAPIQERLGEGAVTE